MAGTGRCDHAKTALDIHSSLAELSGMLSKSPHPRRSACLAPVLPAALLLAGLTLSTRAAAEDRCLHRFERVQLTDTYYSVGANAGDIDRDGRRTSLARWSAGSAAPPWARRQGEIKLEPSQPAEESPTTWLGLRSTHWPCSTPHPGLAAWRASFARNALLAGLLIPLILELGGWLTPSMLYRYAINDEGLLHRGSQRVCDYTAKLQQIADKKKKGEPVL